MYRKSRVDELVEELTHKGYGFTYGMYRKDYTKKEDIAIQLAQGILSQEKEKRHYIIGIIKAIRDKIEEKWMDDNISYNREVSYLEEEFSWILQFSAGLSCFKLIKASELSEEDEFLKYKPKTQNQINFMKNIKIAIMDGLEDFFAPTMEPSINRNGNIYYRNYKTTQHKIGMLDEFGGIVEEDSGIPYHKHIVWWIIQGKMFIPTISRIAQTKEMIAYYAYLLKENIVTWEQLCDNATLNDNDMILDKCGKITVQNIESPLEQEEYLRPYIFKGRNKDSLVTIEDTSKYCNIKLNQITWEGIIEGDNQIYKNNGKMINSYNDIEYGTLEENLNCIMKERVYSKSTGFVILPKKLILPTS